MRFYLSIVGDCSGIDVGDMLQLRKKETGSLLLLLLLFISYDLAYVFDLGLPSIFVCGK